MTKNMNGPPDFSAFYDELEQHVDLRRNKACPLVHEHAHEAIHAQRRAVVGVSSACAHPAHAHGDARRPCEKWCHAVMAAPARMLSVDSVNDLRAHLKLHGVWQKSTAMCSTPSTMANAHLGAGASHSQVQKRRIWDMGKVRWSPQGILSCHERILLLKGNRPHRRAVLKSMYLGIGVEVGLGGSASTVDQF